MTKTPEKTILFYSISTHLGGAEKSLLDILCSLDKVSQGRYHAHALFPMKHGPLIDILKEKKIEYTVLPMPKLLLKMSRNRKTLIPLLTLLALPQTLLYLYQLKNVFQRINPTAIHSTGLKCHLISGVLSHFIKTNIVLHFRDVIESTHINKIIAWFAKNERIFALANSRATAKSVAIKTQIIYNGINIEKFQTLPTHWLHDLLKIPRTNQIIGILGVLARWKGQLNFIKIADQLIQQGNNSHFVIIGDEIYDTLGEQGYRAELTQLVEQLKLTSRVHFTGFLPHPEKALGSIHILVHCSLKPEPFGRVLIESMASRVPVVAAADGGVLEIIEHGKTGLLCKPTDLNAYCEAINSLANDPGRRFRIIDKAFAHVRDKFSLDKQMRGLIEFYDKNLKSHS